MNQVKGKLIIKLESKTGTNAKGVWTKTDFVIETEDQYPKRIMIECWGNDAMALKDMEIGTPLTINVDFESREYNGRWYTSVKAIKIFKT